MNWEQIAERFGSPWKVSQQGAYDLWTTGNPAENQRILLFFPTGEGKTRTSLSLLKSSGYDSAVVLAPPITHASWTQTGKILGMNLRLMSVAKFRQSETKLPKNTPVIVDEVHELGGHNKIGFKKFAKMAQYFPAIILASATPNYNGPERAYCISHITNPLQTKGGFLPWVYKHCETRVNPFASTPYIDGLVGYERVSDWLIDQGYTAFAEDTAVWEEEELWFATEWDSSLFDRYHLDTSQTRIMASQMELNHRITYLTRVNPETGELWRGVADQLFEYLNKEEKNYLIYCAHESVAAAVAKTLDQDYQTYLITGKTSTAQKQDQVRGFVQSPTTAIMVGTSSLATGLDGLDRVCDHLVIFDDIVGDAAKRRQLIGRVLPRSGQDRKTYVTLISMEGDER